jgi:hypothetical protein
MMDAQSVITTLQAKAALLQISDHKKSNQESVNFALIHW